MTKPSEEIQAAARRGLQLLQEGLHTTNAYNRVDFSDLTTFYKNLYSVASHAAQLETQLTRLGVDFEDHSSDDEEIVTPEDIERYIRDISGVSAISRGEIYSTNGWTEGYTSSYSESSGTPRIRLKSVTVRTHRIQQTESFDT